MKVGVYRHYRGGLYLVLGVGAIEATKEKVVIYVPLYEAEGPRMWVRPYAEFHGTVQFCTGIVGEVATIPRFAYVGEELP